MRFQVLVEGAEFGTEGGRGEGGAAVEEEGEDEEGGEREGENEDEWEQAHLLALILLINPHESLSIQLQIALDIKCQKCAVHKLLSHTFVHLHDPWDPLGDHERAHHHQHSTKCNAEKGDVGG